MISRRAKIIGLLSCGAAVAITATIFAIIESKRRSEQVVCGNYMICIGFCVSMWSQEHGNLPPDFVSMKDWLNDPSLLHCPGDHGQRSALQWSDLSPDTCSYEIVTPEAQPGDPKVVFMRCKLHGNLGYADGFVFDGIERRREKK